MQLRETKQKTLETEQCILIHSNQRSHLYAIVRIVLKFIEVSLLELQDFITHLKICS